MTTEEKVRNVLAEQFSLDVKEIKDTDNIFDDLLGDSLDAIEVVMALEETFDLEIPDEEAAKLATVGQIIDYVKKKKS